MNLVIVRYLGNTDKLQLLDENVNDFCYAMARAKKEANLLKVCTESDVFIINPKAVEEIRIKDIPEESISTCKEIPEFMTVTDLKILSV